MSKDNVVKAASPPTQTKVFIQAKPQKLQEVRAMDLPVDFIVLAIITSSFGFIWNPLSRLTGVTETDSRPCRRWAELVREET